LLLLALGTIALLTLFLPIMG